MKTDSLLEPPVDVRGTASLGGILEVDESKPAKHHKFFTNLSRFLGFPSQLTAPHWASVRVVFAEVKHDGDQTLTNWPKYELKPFSVLEVLMASWLPVTAAVRLMQPSHTDVRACVCVRVCATGPIIPQSSRFSDLWPEPSREVEFSQNKFE